MLHFFRSKASSWVMKIILGLILLSFGLWGVSGIFAGRGTQQIVAKVGDIEIGKRYLLNVLQDRIRVVNHKLKGSASFTVEQAVKMGIHKEVLNEIVNKTLLDLEAKDLKLTTDLASIKASIKTDSVFLNKKGEFDRDRYEALLKRAGLSEDQLIFDKKKSIINMQLITGISAVSNVPATLSIELFKSLSEKRDLKVYEINPDTLAKQRAFKNQPISAQEMEAYYNEHKNSFKAPERRRATVLMIDGDKISQAYKFSAQEIQQAYEEKIGDYSVPEKRDMIIWTVSDKKKAQEIYQDISKGHYRKHKRHELPISNVTQDDLQDEIAGPAFDADKAPTLLAPFKTNEGYQIIKITKITPSYTQPLAHVKAQVIEDLRKQKVDEDIARLTQEIEDAVSGGATLEEIARERHLAIKQTGFFQKYQDHQALGLATEIVNAAYEQEAGEDGPVVEINPNKLFIVRVDEVQPAHIPDLSVVKDNVKKALLMDKALATAKDTAGQLQKLGANQQAVDAFVRKHDFIKSVSYPGVSLQTVEDKKLDPAIVDKAFAQTKGQKDIVETAHTVYVVETQRIQPVEVESKLYEYKELKNNMMELLNQDILSQYMEALKQKHDVKIYDEELDTLLS